MNPQPPKHRSLFARIISLEGALAAFGLFSLGSGLWEGKTVPVFWGIMTLIGLAVLYAVRRRDWQKHWDTMQNPGDRCPPPGKEPPQND